MRMRNSHARMLAVFIRKRILQACPPRGFPTVSPDWRVKNFGNDSSPKLNSSASDSSFVILFLPSNSYFAETFQSPIHDPGKSLCNSSKALIASLIFPFCMSSSAASNQSCPTVSTPFARCVTSSGVSFSGSLDSAGGAGSTSIPYVSGARSRKRRTRMSSCQSKAFPPCRPRARVRTA